MVSWFKRPGDSNIPKRKEQLLQRYNLTCHRSELDPKRKKDDEPAVVDDDASGSPHPAFILLLRGRNVVIMCPLRQWPPTRPGLRQKKVGVRGDILLLS